MALYTFFPILPDGMSLTFETQELPDDGAAEAFAITIMQRHRTCSNVAVWCGERQVNAPFLWEKGDPAAKG
jgi:hypothetical protein